MVRMDQVKIFFTVRFSDQLGRYGTSTMIRMEQHQQFFILFSDRFRWWGWKKNLLCRDFWLYKLFASFLGKFPRVSDFELVLVSPFNMRKFQIWKRPRRQFMKGRIEKCFHVVDHDHQNIHTLCRPVDVSKCQSSIDNHISLEKEKLDRPFLFLENLKIIIDIHNLLAISVEGRDIEFSQRIIIFKQSDVKGCFTVVVCFDK